MTEKLQQDIHSLLTAEKIKVKRAICTIESSSIITREIILPHAKPKELKNLVQFEIQQYLPIMMEEYLTVAVIDIGHSQINLSIIDKGIQSFSRIIPQGGKNIDINIANSFNLSVKEAEEKKNQHASLENLTDELSSYDMVNELIRSGVEVWIEDIQRILKLK